MAKADYTPLTGDLVEYRGKKFTVFKVMGDCLKLTYDGRWFHYSDVKFIKRQPPKKSLRCTLKNVLGNGDPGTSTYGIRFKDKDGTLFDKLQIADVCHARFNGHEQAVDVIDAVHHLRNHYFDEEGAFSIEAWEQDRKYVDYILNRSPFSDCFVTKGTASAIRYGVQFDVTKPLDWLVGAAIALRTTTEFPHSVRKWYELIELGFTPNEAYLLHTFVSSLDVKADKIRFTFHGGGHMAVAATFSFGDYVRFIKRGMRPKEAYKLQSFKQEPTSQRYRVNKFICSEDNGLSIGNVIRQLPSWKEEGKGWNLQMFAVLSEFINQFKEAYANEAKRKD